MTAIVPVVALAAALLALQQHDAPGAALMLLVAGLGAGALLRGPGRTRDLRTPSEAEGWGYVDSELRRARRHGRHLTLCQVVLDDGQDVEAMLRTAERSLRAEDLAFVSRRSIFVVFPEVDQEAARVPLARLSARMADVGCRGQFAHASYPDDALTIDGLLVTMARLPRSPLGTVFVQDDEADIFMADDETTAFIADVEADAATIPRPRDLADAADDAPTSVAVES